jgi:serine/threonine protein kinase
MTDSSTRTHGLRNTRASPEPTTLGRFELRKILGQGAQSTVWLAFDPRMEREVAIKVMHPSAGSDDASVGQWLQEARNVGRVKHPNIVPVYEADIQDRQPYLVFEYIAGRTLEQVIQERGALPPQEAVALMMDVLDAVAVAHNAGVVHRDLKPSNVLVDAAGHARVMDFGIAARIKDRADKGPDVLVCGTLGYLSPEAAKGESPSTAMDIFSAGLVLAELISGKRLVPEKDPHRAIYRVVNEQLTLPEGLSSAVDDGLRAIVLRALARDPQQRFSTVRAFQAELEQWAKPTKPAEAKEVVSSAKGNSTLDFLLRRMRHKSDFPAMSDSVVRIQSMATSDTESINSVTNEILKDVALTNKLLRMVNSANYARGSSISTVSRAVSLVGFNGIRNMALSLVLLEHMQDKAHAAQLKEEFLRSLMAGSIAGELCPVLRESEEAFIGSMFQNMGRLLVQFYFTEEAAQVRSLVQSQREPMEESAASVRVLGISYEELGLGVAKSWGLPDGIQQCMRRLTGLPPLTAPTDSGERIRWIAQASNEIADVLLHCKPESVDTKLTAVTLKYIRAMGVSSKAVAAATATARKKLIDLAQAMDIRVLPGSAAARLLSDPSSPPGASAPTPEQDGVFKNLELHATTVLPGAAPDAPPVRNGKVTETLVAGIQDITNAMVEDFKLADVLRMILETMYRAMEFDRIIFCMRDAKAEMVTGRFGLGQGVEQYVKSFKVMLKSNTPDLFSVVCNKGVDTMINDATEARIVQRLPEWFKKGINAPTFLLLPLHIKGAPFGLIYADKTAHGSLELDEKELAMLRTLRNQAVMAFKQSS